MTTRLYLHSPDSTVVGTLPTTEQSSRTAALNFDAQTVNRSMNTTVGVGQVQLFRNSSNANNAFVYITKFVSDTLNMTSVAANTWTYNFAFKIANTNNQTAPIFDNGSIPTAEFDTMPATCYVWRPGTGAKVGDIFDGLTAGTNGEFFDCAHISTSELAENGTFTGASVAGVQTGDVIILEAWCYSTDSTARTNALNYYFDGTTVTTTVETVVSNHASFLETPETLVFQGAAASTARQYKSFTNTGFYPSQASIMF